MTATPFDGVAFGREMVGIVKAHVAAALAPLQKTLDEAKAENTALRERLAALETCAAVAGPQGPAGPAGPPGPAGGRGPTGEKGDVGPMGPAGKDGTRGEKGDLGPIGPAGPQGIKGLDGASGKDGAPGPQGSRGLQGEKGDVGLMGKDGTAGRDGQPGVPGRDGQDGMGFDNLDVVYDGARTLTFRMARGERQKEAAIVLPIVLDQGVWEERQYVKGDGVTFRGSYWIAQADTKAKPGSGVTDWRLAVKRGADARGAP